MADVEGVGLCRRMTVCVKVVSLLPLVLGLCWSVLVRGMAASPAAFKRVLVTGANKGIGREICRRILADVEDSYVILGSRSVERGEAAVRTLLEQEPASEGRLEMVQIDVEDDASVAAAVETIVARHGADAPLYGLCNNAGIGFGHTIPETLSANFYSQVRVASAFVPLLNPETGRICNIASASGPNYVRDLDGDLKALFTSKETTMEELDAELQRQSALTDYDGSAYGLSKAAVNIWTRAVLAPEHPNLKVNSCSPGYVLTDLTAGMGATKKPEDSTCHVAPLFLLFGEPEGNGRYYGSDAVRSPIDVYRGPGEPPYVADD
uniref:Protochlorophyllide reductase n=1 Tax=Rhizochromulina marina TaxID=1034831 RepID=A0A7S2W576_9STRA